MTLTQLVFYLIEEGIEFSIVPKNEDKKIRITIIKMAGQKQLRRDLEFETEYLQSTKGDVLDYEIATMFKELRTNMVQQ